MKKDILKAVKKTSDTQQKKRCLHELPDILSKLEQDLKEKTYHPKRFSCFVVKDPKVREIFAPNYIDRIVHHLVMGEIEGELDKKFIYDCSANRKNKGVHFGVKRVQRFLKKKDQKYYLQADIKSFFPTIDKKILWKLVKKHIEGLKNTPEEKKEMVLDVCKKTIFQNPTQIPPEFTGDKNLLKLVPPEKSLFHLPKGKGLPIGSLTSQFFANVYLNELDQFVKHQLKVKYYVRYVDDFVILGENTTELLSHLKKIEDFLEKELKLKVHPKKTRLQHCSKGLDFLGFIVKKDYLLVRKRSVKALKRRLYFFNHLLDPKAFPRADAPSNFKISTWYFKKKIVPPVNPDILLLNKMLSVINSYYGIFSFANSFNLRKSLYEKHFHLLKKYFVPKDKSFKTLKIRLAFKEKKVRKPLRS